VNRETKLKIPKILSGPASVLALYTVVAFSGSLVATPTAQAGLKLCNKTNNLVGVALGYKDQKGWASEGWWNVDPNVCQTLLEGPLIARYYYIFAIDMGWLGKAVHSRKAFHHSRYKRMRKT